MQCLNGLCLSHYGLSFNVNNNKVSLTQPDFFNFFFNIQFNPLTNLVHICLYSWTTYFGWFCDLQIKNAYFLFLVIERQSSFKLLFFSLLSFAFYFPNIFCLN